MTLAPHRSHPNRERDYDGRALNGKVVRSKMTPAIAVQDLEGDRTDPIFTTDRTNFV